MLKILVLVWSNDKDECRCKKCDKTGKDQFVKIMLEVNHEDQCKDQREEQQILPGSKPFDITQAKQVEVDCYDTKNLGPVVLAIFVHVICRDEGNSAGQIYRGTE